jgi:hypothetical protein
LSSKVKRHIVIKVVVSFFYFQPGEKREAGWELRSARLCASSKKKPLRGPASGWLWGWILKKNGR